MADWSSLSLDLVRRVADCFLATNDLDYYIDFRAVCRNWCSATADPKADSTDPRFHPSKWVMLEHSMCVVKFVNVSTGRFLRKRILLLCKYFFVAATDGGLLVLGEKVPPYQTRVFNPFTGNITNFRAPVVAEEVTSVAVTTSPMMVFISGICNSYVKWADQNSEAFHEFTVDPPNYLLSMTPVAGDVYVTNGGSMIMSTVDVAAEESAQGRSAQAMTMATTTIHAPTSAEGDCDYYLVESAGELLLVSRPWYRTVVLYKVDTGNKLVEPVRSIGNRALFVSYGRSISVDADKFPTIEGGCIYFVDHALTRAGEYECYLITMLRLADGWEEPMLDLGYLRGCFHPFTLVQVFADYCRFVKYSQLELELILYSEDDGYEESD